MDEKPTTELVTRSATGARLGRQQIFWGLAVFGACVLFSLFTVFDQVLNRTGIEFLENDQLMRHRNVLEGRAIDPWQYRIFAEYVVEVAIRAANWLGLSSAVLKAFVAVRVAQNLLIFLAAAVYWRLLGLRRLITLLALAAFAWGITYSGYASDLAFSTYFDILFYLISGILILTGRYVWLVPVVAFAALNRETSGLIPVMLAAVAVGRLGSSRKVDRRALIVAGVCLGLYLVETGMLRVVLGPRELMHPYDHSVGLDLLVFNLTNRYTYVLGFSTLSVIPLIALFYWRRWPPILHRFFWGIVPVWMIVHLLAGALAEGRLLLVPHALVFMPAAFLAAQGESQ